ncbi:UNVERIFIED_CONTAM: hypothetical protein FKN15_017123 [Acipenser sinensis]
MYNGKKPRKVVFQQFSKKKKKRKERCGNRALPEQLVAILRKHKDYVERCWKDVRVGDFVKVVCNEIIPADILLLHTSDVNGVCHIETANLDGETNLKQRRVVRGFLSPIT